MTPLLRTFLALGLAAGPVSHRAGRAERPLDELPKAPVMIVLPEDATPRGAASTRKASPPVAPAKTPKASPPPGQAIAPAPKALEVPRADGAKPAAVANPPHAVATSVPLPPERRPGYGLVAQKCGRCHGVEKALNAGYSADEWDAYLRRKYRRAGAGITAEQAAEIGAFLRGLAAHLDDG